MDADLKEAITRILLCVSKFYYRLIVFVAPHGGGKTRFLRKIATWFDAPIINLNLELSYRMLDLTRRQRALKLPELLMEVVEQAKAKFTPNTLAYNLNLILFDNTELLFDRDLEQDPLRLLLSISRNNVFMERLYCRWTINIRIARTPRI